MEWLLRRHQWSEDAVIQVSVWLVFTSPLPWQLQKYLSHGEDILTEAGLTKPKTTSKTLSQKSSTCKVCLSEVSDIASLPCEHPVCKVSHCYPLMYSSNSLFQLTLALHQSLNSTITCFWPISIFCHFSRMDLLYISNREANDSKLFNEWPTNHYIKFCYTNVSSSVEGCSDFRAC